MPINALFIDLDDTLYDPSTGIWSMIRERIGVYMHERLGIDEKLVPAMRKDLFLKYGTTMKGLKVKFDIDEDEYLQFVHDVPVDQLITPNPRLHKMLTSLSQQKFIFTNADSRHAARVTKALGITDCFNGVMDIIQMFPFCKPQAGSFQKVLDLSGETSTENCIVIDDSIQNLQAAKALGFGTILVGMLEDAAADAIIPKLDLLPSVLPSFEIK